ncbi:hypothetical protein BALOs_0038 [Halobacteriovorax sp. BALOs_7]|uniref:hypothetical protein n=1 Tax=Halobacteriovorax sp. BALOs_7 TaxID=2109558 RepID=UPI000EA3AFAF|nr:hypothetical protein [Halobacteriovorax sp. BALOs_7]AYF43062.1 hypothetical protein BALOs_0038 [Halobacteriovorax sp. BALOs_7]
MKAVVTLILLSTSIFANPLTSRGAGGGSGTLAPESNRSKDEILGAGGGSGTLRNIDIIDLHSGEGYGGSLSINERDLLIESIGGTSTTDWSVGKYEYVSSLDRWVLKTKTRLLSLKDIELVDKFESKQNEVKNFSNNMRSRNNRINNRFLKTMLERSIKFQKYKINDFEY